MKFISYDNALLKYFTGAFWSNFIYLRRKKKKKHTESVVRTGKNAKVDKIGNWKNWKRISNLVYDKFNQQDLFEFSNILRFYPYPNLSIIMLLHFFKWYKKKLYKRYNIIFVIQINNFNYDIVIEYQFMSLKDGSCLLKWKKKKRNLTN